MESLPVVASRERRVGFRQFGPSPWLDGPGLAMDSRHTLLLPPLLIPANSPHARPPPRPCHS